MSFVLFEVLAETTKVGGVKNVGLRFIMSATVSLIHVSVTALRTEALFTDLIQLLFL